MTLQIRRGTFLRPFYDERHVQGWLRTRAEDAEFERAEAEMAAALAVLRDNEQRQRQDKMNYPSGLPVGSDQIRLLALLPGRPDDEVKCVLRVASLADQPQYEALSYTWGTRHGLKYITLHGIAGFPVTDNADSALRRLRRSDSTRLLWIDAICINQSDLSERSQQVSLMGRIYREASSVAVWLGDYGIDNVDETETLGHNVDMQGAMNAIMRHARPEWWRRAWIVQEVAYATNVQVYFGPFQRFWGDFCWEILGLSSKDRRGYTSKHDPVHSKTTERWSRYGMRQEMVKRFDMIINVRGSVVSAGSSDDKRNLLSVASWTKDQDCSSGSDKVYSVLSLIHPKESQMIRPDYTVGPSRVFAQATYASFAAHGTFDILALKSLRQDNPSLCSSWAVDFSRIYSFDKLENFDRYEVEWPGQQVECHATMATTSVLSVTGLKASGAEFDTVTNICHVSSLLGDLAETELVTFLESAIANMSQNSPYEVLRGRPLQANIPLSTQLPSRSNLLETFVRSQVRRSGRFWRSLDPMDGLTVRDILGSAFELWSELANIPTSVRERVAILDIVYDLHPFWSYARSAAFDVVVFVTSAGFIGLAPGCMRPGDTIALLHGSKCPVILRSYDFGREDLPSYERPALRQHGKHWTTFWGFAYVHGLMSRELLHMSSAADFVEKTFNVW